MHFEAKWLAGFELCRELKWRHVEFFECGYIGSLHEQLEDLLSSGFLGCRNLGDHLEDSTPYFPFHHYSLPW